MRNAVAIAALLLASCDHSPKDDKALTAARADFMEASKDAIAQFRREAEACEADKNRDCVRAKAKRLLALYETVSHVDKVDRGEVLRYWTEVLHSGELGYVPR